LCSGNYYRSRFAEYLFNALAPQRKLDWEATSRGLARQFSPLNIGPLSRHAATGLAARKIMPSEPIRLPLRAVDGDFAAANLVVALKEQEHRRLVELYYATWTERVEYWQVHDLDCAPPEEALAEIDSHVRELLERLEKPAADCVR
jgi:protein-tyrosine phosphatase